MVLRDENVEAVRQGRLGDRWLGKRQLRAHRRQRKAQSKRDAQNGGTKFHG
jgi:hypothetical protein